MNPSIQVAFVSVLASFVTTMGVIVAALINNRKNKAPPSEAKAIFTEKDVLERMLAMLNEIHRNESIIEELRLQIQILQEENQRLRARLQGPIDSTE